MQPIIQVENVEYTYPGEEQPALRGVTLSIEPGTFTAVLGHNGSGKSTLAKHFNAILLPTSGRVLVDGMDTADEENLLRVRGTVGMVFQNPDNQIVANVVEDDVAFAPENLGVEPQEIRRRVDEALKQVGMYEYRTHAPHLLSGGQKQRVAIAGVIAMRPKCIVLDEPTAMLDPSGRREVVSTALKLCREPRHVRRTCDRRRQTEGRLRAARAARIRGARRAGHDGAFTGSESRGARCADGCALRRSLRRYDRPGPATLIQKEATL